MKVKSELVIREADDVAEKTRAELIKSDPDDGKEFGSLLKAGKLVSFKPQVEQLDGKL